MIKLLTCGFTPPMQDGILKKVKMLLTEQKVQQGILDPKGNPAQMGKSIMAQPRAIVLGDPERPPKRIEFRIVHLDEPVPADMDLYESFTMPDGSELAFFIRK